MVDPIGGGLVLMLILAAMFGVLCGAVVLGRAWEFLTDKSASVRPYKMPAVIAVLSWYGLWLTLLRSSESGNDFLLDALLGAPLVASLTGTLLCAFVWAMLPFDLQTRIRADFRKTRGA